MLFHIFIWIYDIRIKIANRFNQRLREIGGEYISLFEFLLYTYIDFFLLTILRSKDRQKLNITNYFFYLLNIFCSIHFFGGIYQNKKKKKLGKTIERKTFSNISYRT